MENSVDRLAPTHRPEARVVGWQTWRDLLFVHWTPPLQAVRALVPETLELDLFEDRIHVGLVPFRMCRIRPRWLPSWLALDFLEANLRTYVRYRGEPGVYFFSLEASSWLAVQAARRGWGLPYFHARMQLAAAPPLPRAGLFERAPGVRYQYGSARRDGTGFAASWTVGEALGPSGPGSLAFFLLERYLLFVPHKRGMLRGQVHHSPYPIQAVQVEQLDESLFVAAGLSPAAEPACVHFSPGVAVEIFALERV